MVKYIDDKGLKRFAGNVDDQINNARYSILKTKGKANGIASLDSKGFVPLDQLGNLDMTFFEPVQELPTSDIKKHIYLIKNEKEGAEDAYTEYIYTGDIEGEYDESKWEKLGDFVPTFDLKEYAKKDETVRIIQIVQSGNGDCKIIYTMTDGSTNEVVMPLASAIYESLFPIEDNSVSTQTAKPSGYWNCKNGLMSGEDKHKLDQIDTEALSQSITNANTAADNTNAAISACKTATEGAEKVNVELSGNSIITTDRNGVKKSVDVIDTQEQVTVTITSQVDSINVSGIKVNVFLNNGKTPQTYTTNDEGKCSFVIDRGNYYEVSVPEYANAQPLSPVGYTAVLANREIAFEYVPYDEETSEKVIVTVTKYVDKVGTAWQGKEVKVKYDGKTTTYTTDEKGQAIVYVGYKKEYTVTVDNEDGYLVYFGKNSRTYTARVTERRISVKMYQFETGIFVMDSNDDSYTIEEWQEAGKTSNEAVAIKVADYNLMTNNGTFMIRTSDLQNMSKLVSLQWCTQNLQFNSIALNGNSSSDANYWSGEQSTLLVMQEAEERSLSVPAFNYAYNQAFEIGENIGDTALHGFLMSVGQEYVHIANAGVIRDVLAALYGEDVGKDYYTSVNSKRRWTSTQANASNAWYCNSQANNNNKNYGGYVLPVFAC